MQKLFSLLAITFFSLFCHLGYAQNSQVLTKEAFAQKSIYLKTSFFGTKYIKGGEAKSFSFWNDTYRNDIKKSSKAIMYYDKARKNQYKALGLSLLGTALTIVGISRLSTSETHSNYVNRNKQAVALVSLGLISSIVSIPITVRSTNQVQLSIWEYNKDLF